MTREEFMGQFTRLCRGLEYEATPEQGEAVYRRIGHVALSVWAESVTTLLCDGRKGYLPKLEHVLDVIEREGEAQRKAAVLRDRPRAESVLQRLSREASEDELARIPTPGTPLFACIKAFAGREQARKRLALNQQDSNRQEIEQAITEYDREIAELSPLLHDDDAARLVKQYESGFLRAV